MGGQAGPAVMQGALSETGDLMTQAQIQDSQKFAGICDTQGNCISNASGDSTGGPLGYMFKLGGGRLDLSLWCANGACDISPTPTNAFSVNPDSTVTYYAVNPGGTVIYNPKDSNGVPLNTTINQFIAANQNNPNVVSPLGGIQGGSGQMTIPGIGAISYTPGSLLDNLVESYAGMHDTLNSGTWYDSLGNDKQLTGINQTVGNVTNWTNVLLATPVAGSILLSPGNWSALNALVK
jgi:filamentous hemagglutinin